MRSSTVTASLLVALVCILGILARPGSAATSDEDLCNPNWIGDGECDARNNNEACGNYDGGDCCECTCTGFCGSTSLNCLDPMAPVAPCPGAPCSNGVIGVEKSNQCCVSECGECGGSGCKDRAEALGLTADDCCTGRIRSAGVLCSDTRTAPCTVDDRPSCSNGIAGIEASGVCCTSSCGTCGGSGCKEMAEAIGLTANDCCAARIMNAGVHCDDSGAAPCIL